MAGLVLDTQQGVLAEADSEAQRSTSAVASPPTRHTHDATIIIRHAHPEDLTGMRHVLRACGLASKRDLAVITGGVVLVAERDGQIVGVIQCLLGLPCAYISYLAVLPDARANGRTMLRLVTALEDILRSLGIPAWLANTSNTDPAWQRALVKWGARPAEDPTTLHVKELSPHV